MIKSVMIKLALIGGLVIFISSCSDSGNKESKQGSVETPMVDSSSLYFDSLKDFARQHSGRIPYVFERIDGSSGLSFKDNIRQYLNMVNEVRKKNEKAKPPLSDSLFDQYILKPHVTAFSLQINCEHTFIPEAANHFFLLTTASDSSSYNAREGILTVVIEKAGTDSLIRKLQKPVSNEEWSKFMELLDYAEFWSLGEESGNTVDACGITLAGVDIYAYDHPKATEGRNIVRRSALENTALGAACNYLITLYDKDITNMYLLQKKGKVNVLMRKLAAGRSIHSSY